MIEIISFSVLHMKLYILFFACTLLSCSTLLAQDISLDQAKTLGEAAMALYTDSGSMKKSIKVKSNFTKSLHKEVTYYILNMEPTGFVVMSADERYHPVLAFSQVGHIDFNHPEANIGLWGELSRHEQNIEYLRKEEKTLTSYVIDDWVMLQSIAAGSKKSLTFNAVVEPLTTTKWNQSGYYNDSCPPDSLGPNGNTYCGCVPIAVSQLMRFYENAIPGNGSVSYVDLQYGPQSVDLCGQQFDWASMPDTLSESNLVLADFIYDVGKTMETNYSISYTGTYAYKVRDALIYNYGFDHRMKSYRGTNAAQYSKTLKEEFENGRVVFLSAWSVDSLDYAESGHAWIADGYGYSKSGAEYMHFNWGWGGSNNGWFLDTESLWLPHEANQEQAKVSYYWYRYTLYNIFPASEDCQFPDPSITSVDPDESYAWMYYRSPVDEEVQFRYREKGAAEWIINEATYKYYSHARNLNKGTTYEYQLTRNCCGEWSSFSNVAEFNTLGSAQIIEPQTSDECAAEDGVSLSTSSVSDHFAYIYTDRPHGRVNNQFRYRKYNATDWNVGQVNATHYYTLSDLAAGTTYEFQVRHECADNIWSDYSTSNSFMTTGEINSLDETAIEEDQTDQSEEIDSDSNEEEAADDMVECPQVRTSSFTAGYQQASAVTAYFVEASVGSIFRWRYRAAETDTAWLLTGESIFTSANLTGLQPATSYEYQVAQQCESGWSEYSESRFVSTTALTHQITELRHDPVNTTSSYVTLELSVYPNPTANLLMLELSDGGFAQQESIKTVQVFDRSGQLIMHLDAVPHSRIQIDVSQFTKGVYHTRVVLSDGFSLYSRFVKL